MSVKLKQVFSGKRLDEVHALYETAFPASEKKPFSMIVSGQGTGLVEILSLEENNRFLGLAIMAKAGDRVLLDYFAIADEVRGHGAGSAALQALRERYQGMRIIIEIESTKRNWLSAHAGKSSICGMGLRCCRTTSISGGRRWRCFQMVSHARMRNISISIQRHLEQKYPIRSIF